MKKLLALLLVAIMVISLFASCAQKGEKGDTGAQGVQGEQGIQGEKGEKGDQGEQGIQGEKGDKGDQGEKGEKGDQGEQGIQGEKGDQGEQGIQGEKGDKGDKGDTGTSIVVKASADACLDYGDGYIDKNGHLQILNDINSRTFIDAGEIKGPKGDKGEQGETGKTGAQGEQGQKGEDGENGKDGKDGDTPYIGGNGNWWIGTTDTGVKAEGENGKDGKDGENGKDGKDGKDGDTPYIGGNGNWWIGTTDTGVKAEGENGKDGKDGATGKSAFELYKETYGYSGTEQQWISDLVQGNLIKYTVTFDLNNGKAGTGFESSVSVFSGGTVKLSIPTRDGYSFAGWFTGDTIVDGIFTTTDKVTEDLNLIARWTPNTMTVRFLDYYGETLAVKNVDYGTAVVAPSAPTEVEKKIFYGWDKSLDCVTENMTVNPIYVGNVYTVHYNTNGGSEVEDSVYYHGEITKAPENPTKTGLNFAGWYTEPEFVNLYKFGTALNIETTLYAYFSDMIPIYTVDDLKNIAINPAADYALMSDINFKGAEWTPIASFSGIFDGNGHKIAGFTITTTAEKMSFFGDNSGTIKNVIFSGVEIVDAFGENGFEAVVASQNSGTIENVAVKNSTVSRSYSISSGKTNYVGGLVGRNSGNISKCTVEAEINLNSNASTGSTISIYNYIGGISGANYGGATVLDCVATISSNLTYEGNSIGGSGTWKGINFHLFYGGISGMTNNSTVKNCSTNVNLNVDAKLNVEDYWYRYDALYGRLGGLVGETQDNSVVQYCESHGNVYLKRIGNCSSGNMGYDEIGGAIGCITSASTVDNIYSDVNLSGYGLTGGNGGICGHIAVGQRLSNALYAGTITAAENYVSGSYWFGGICGGLKGTVTQCVNLGTFDGKFENKTGSIAAENYSTGMVSKCVSDSNITNVCGTTSGTVSKVIVVGVDKSKTDTYTEDCLFDTLYFDNEIWKITDGEKTELQFMLND